MASMTQHALAAKTVVRGNAVVSKKAVKATRVNTVARAAVATKSVRPPTVVYALVSSSDARALRGFPRARARNARAIVISRDRAASATRIEGERRARAPRTRRARRQFLDRSCGSGLSLIREG
jgi:hypothetical protein